MDDLRREGLLGTVSLPCRLLGKGNGGGLGFSSGDFGILFFNEFGSVKMGWVGWSLVRGFTKRDGGKGGVLGRYLDVFFLCGILVHSVVL